MRLSPSDQATLCIVTSYFVGGVGGGQVADHQRHRDHAEEGFEDRPGPGNRCSWHDFAEPDGEIDDARVALVLAAMSLPADGWRYPGVRRT